MDVFRVCFTWEMKLNQLAIFFMDDGFEWMSHEEDALPGGSLKKKVFCFEATFWWFQLVACAVIVVVAAVAVVAGGGGGRGGAAAECVCTYHTIYCSCTYIYNIFIYTYIFVYIRLYFTILHVQSSSWRKIYKLVAPLHSMFSSPGHWYL